MLLQFIAMAEQQASPEEATIRKMLTLVPSPARKEVEGVLRQYSERYGGALSSVNGEVAKTLEAALKKGTPDAVRNALSAALKNQPEGIVPRKVGNLPAEAFFGQLFADNWKQFFENHKDEYSLFLKQSGGLADNEQVRKQWSVAWMVYRMGRYGGSMGVNFKYTDKRVTLKNVGEVPPSVRDDASIHGKAFSFLMKDVVYGSRYRDGASKQDYLTFGDCDEVSLMMAQMLRYMSDKNNLGMDMMVYRLSGPSHAGVGVTIGEKWFYLEPSLYEIEYPKNLARELTERRDLEGSSELDKKLVNVALSALSKGKPPASIFKDDYESGPARRLEAALKQKPELWPRWRSMSDKDRDKVIKTISLPSISPSQQEMVTAAAKTAVGMSPEEALVRREASRRRWGNSFVSISYRLDKNVLPKLLKEPGGTARAISMLTDLVASSLDGPYRQNVEELQAAIHERTEAQKISILKDMAMDMKRTGYSMSEAKKRFAIA